MTQLVNDLDYRKGFPQTGTQSGTKNSADVYIQGGGHQGPEGEGGNAQALTFNATSAASSAITATLIDVTALTNSCFIQIGASPVAVVDDDYFVPVNTTYRFPITSGNSVAAIQLTATGTLYISPVK